MADLDSLHYPERLGQIFVVNAPYMLAVAWRVIRSWLDERTKQKIHILRGVDEHGPILCKELGEDVVPVEFGGKAQALEPVHGAPKKGDADFDDAEAIGLAKAMAGSTDDEVYKAIAEKDKTDGKSDDPRPTSPAPPTSPTSPTTEVDPSLAAVPKPVARRSSWWPFGSST